MKPEIPDKKPIKKEWLEPIVHRFTETWTNATSLTLDRIDRHTRSSSAWNQFLATDPGFRRGITDLRVSRFGMTNSVEDSIAFLRVVTAFPSIQKLKIDPFTPASYYPEVSETKAGVQLALAKMGIQSEGDKVPDGGLNTDSLALEEIVNDDRDEAWEDVESDLDSDIGFGWHGMGEQSVLDDGQVLAIADFLGGAPANLQVLEVTGETVFCPFPLRILWEWLRKGGACHLQSLDIRLEYMQPADDLPALARYLEAVGSELKMLKVYTGHKGRDIDPYPGPGEMGDARCILRQLLRNIVEKKVFSKSEGIEEATFECIFFYDLAHKHPMSLIEPDKLISSLSGKSLKRLNLSIWTDCAEARYSDLEEEASLDEVAWRNADTLIADEKIFPALKQVVVSVTVARDHHFEEEYDLNVEEGDIPAEELSEDHVVQWMEKYMPKCIAKGILEFKHQKWDDVDQVRFGIPPLEA
ncbi:hypothetical protein VNI00_016292 [Paramarasmius palmivorus]|uniref:F-box protein n=1 Tax=Paramarasmius palmivorus TaxID=297713 RepID=A0AAW0BFB0_9AGAR